jgi:hypothetical protein
MTPLLSLVSSDGPRLAPFSKSAGPRLNWRNNGACNDRHILFTPQRRGPYEFPNLHNFRGFYLHSHGQ